MQPNALPLTELPGDHYYARELAADAAQSWIKTQRKPVIKSRHR